MKSRLSTVQCLFTGVLCFASSFSLGSIESWCGTGFVQEPNTQSAPDEVRPLSLLVGDKYELDNAHTSLVFAVSHFGLSYTYGRFNECAGSFSVSEGNPTDAGFTFLIKSESIDTNNPERDEHLRGPDFFDTQQFPKIEFVTTGVVKVDDIYQVTGDFTMLGQTRSVMMPIRMVGMGKGPFGKHRAGFFTKFTIKRSEFGMSKMLGQVGDNISITFSFEGVRQ